MKKKFFYTIFVLSIQQRDRWCVCDQNSFYYWKFPKKKKFKENKIKIITHIYAWNDEENTIWVVTIELLAGV